MKTIEAACCACEERVFGRTALDPSDRWCFLVSLLDVTPVGLVGPDPDKGPGDLTVICTDCALCEMRDALNEARVIAPRGAES